MESSLTEKISFTGKRKTKYEILKSLSLAVYFYLIAFWLYSCSLYVFWFILNLKKSSTTGTKRKCKNWYRNKMMIRKTKENFVEKTKLYMWVLYVWLCRSYSFVGHLFSTSIKSLPRKYLHTLTHTHARARANISTLTFLTFNEWNMYIKLKYFK